jgi:hypothetical protein
VPILLKSGSLSLLEPPGSVQAFNGIALPFLAEDLRVTLFARVVESKGKAVPLQAWNGPEGSRKLRFPDYMTTAQDRGKVVSLTHWLPLPPGNAPGTHFC